MRVALNALTMMAVSAAVLLPLSATAKRPTGDCTVLVDSDLELDVPFVVTVRRDPAFPGQWFSPTITVEVVAPVVTTASGPGAYSQIVTQEFNGILTSNRAEAAFVIPPLPNREINGPVDVFATVIEPINKGLSKDSFCSAVTNFLE